MPPFNSLIQRAPVGTGNVCTTPECISASDMLKQYVNLTVDPCSDFYEYTCGSWIRSPDVSAYTTTIDTFYKTTQASLGAIQNILEGTYEDIFQNLKTNDEGFHLPDEIETDRANFQEIQNFYDACLNVTQIRSFGPSPMYQDIAEIQQTLFPVASTANVAQNIARTLASFARQDIPSLIYTNIDVDEDDHSYHIPFIIYPDFSPEGEYDSVYEEDEEFLTKIVNWTMSSGHGNAQWTEEGERVNISYWPYEMVGPAVRSYKTFTETLKEAINKTLDGTETSTAPQVLSQLQEASTSIDWTTFLDDLISPGYAQPTTRLGTFTPYFVALDQILRTKSLEEIQQYFIIRHIISKSGDVIFPFTRTAKEIKDNTTDNTTADPEALHLKQQQNLKKRSILSRRSPGIIDTDPSTRRYFCVSHVDTHLSDSVGRFFALRTFGGSKERDDAERLVEDIQNSWINHLPTVSWLDDETKAKAIEKAKMTKRRIGYKTSNPDWRSPVSIKTFYDGLAIDENNYYNANRAVISFRSNQIWKMLNQRAGTNDWMPGGYPHMVNAANYIMENAIEIPIGILQPPFYDPTFPKYMIHGALGGFIGHEFTHGLDSDGKNYNATGYKNNWWTNHSSTEFERRSQCFIDQYSKEYYESETAPKKLEVDGQLTLGENIADSGGISIALAAYRDYINKNGQQAEPLLPGFETLTQEQLFFISHGVSFCSYNPANLNGLDVNDPHAPWPTRINLPLRNSVEFAKAFQCAPGTPMNPQKTVEEKCALW